MMRYRITDDELIDEVVDTASREEAIAKLYELIYEYHGVYTYNETYRAYGKVYQFHDGSWDFVDSLEFIYDPTPPPCLGKVKSHEWADESTVSEGIRVLRKAKCRHCSTFRFLEVNRRGEVVSVEYFQADDDEE